MAKKRPQDKTPTPLEALEWLQKNGISAKTAAKFNAETRRERRASSIKMEERSKKAWAAVGLKY
jgi:hypothetical protein